MKLGTSTMNLLHLGKFSIFAVIQCVFVITYALALSNVQESLPFCGISQALERFVLVSTLDGKITALNPSDGGSAVWTVHPGHEPMLSSSIHRLELTNYGQLVRMIPSLNGGLYKFNGETVEPIPLTADHLLQASFRYSDDLVISGGKESQTVGVSLQTGEVLYECSMRGCTDDGSRPAGDVLLVQRMGQVVRAVEPRTGAERWNFSVAQHDLKLISECHSSGQSSVALDLKVIVPEGLVFAMDPENPSVILWKHKFDSPVVSAWEIQKDKILEVDLFSRSSQQMSDDVSPSLYIGMHEKQLYIQESVTMLERRQELAMQYGKNLITHETGIDRLPWRPVLANARNVGLEIDVSSNEIETDTSLEEAPTTALSVLYGSSYVDGMGFYLYSKEAIKVIGEALCNVTIAEPEEEVEETPVTVVIVSLWYWWREVAVISITTAVVFNLLFTRRYLRQRVEVLLPVTEVAPSRSDSGVVMDSGSRNSESQSADYISRYLTDFEPVHCLGKGGYGVVFEARNKIDDCHYAIKRIVLPDAPQSRERVMREVRALAKLDHHHIVRYFNSWMECPPPGWQRAQDLQCISDEDCNQQSELVSETTTSCYPSPSRNGFTKSTKFSSSKLTLEKKYDMSDSFIVFASESNNSESIIEEEECRKEHSIVIESSRSNSEKKRRRPKTLEWTEHSTICQSPCKVYLYIQMQLCKRESLKDWLLHHPDRDYQTAIEIFEQIVKAVDYVHFHNLIHRDLKPSNIFFSMDQQIKVGDFGLVTAIADDEGRLSLTKEAGRREGHTSQVGTQLYMSPEQLSGRPYSYKVDIFSLGLILFELLVPFSTQMERSKVLQDVRSHKFPPAFARDYEVEIELLKRMLSDTPEERPTAAELLSSPPLLSGHQTQTADTRLWQSDIRGQRRESSRTSVSSASSSDACLEVK